MMIFELDNLGDVMPPYHSGAQSLDNIGEPVMACPTTNRVLVRGISRVTDRPRLMLVQVASIPAGLPHADLTWSV